MKVVCPECSAEFDVPADALGLRGRRVRCASCHHIWLQEPVFDDIAGAGEQGGASSRFRGFDDSLDIEPIPMSVHPRDDDDDDDGEGRGPSFFSTIDYAYLGRMAAGFACGVALITVLLMGGAMAGFKPAVFAPFYSASAAG